MVAPRFGSMFVCRPKPIALVPRKPQGLTLMSDLHIGAAHVDYRKIKHELAEAKRHGDRININGDVFDMVLVKDAKRFTPGVLHPKLRGRGDIINKAVEWAAEMLLPYVNQIDMIGIGNHESSVEKYHNIDVVKMLIYELNKHKADEHTIHYGGYTGFISYSFSAQKEDGGVQMARANQPRVRPFVVYYHHGSGGAAPVTKGMIDFNRKDTAFDADVLWMGHKHNRWAGHVQRVSCPLTGHNVVVRDVRHVMTGAYFRTYEGQTQESLWKHGRVSNYAADAGMAPGGMGGARVLVSRSSNHQPISLRVRVVQ